MTDRLNKLEEKIGYKFNNRELLSAALTHSSYINEHRAASNERIEFLGDCVLNFTVGEQLFRKDPTASEGALSARRAAIVSRAPLARLVDKLGLLEYLQVGAGVDKSAFSQKARSDVYEAIVGAIYIDGGMDAARKFLDRTFFGEVRPERDYKSELQVAATARGITVVYETQPIENGFDTVVKFGDKSFSGSGKTKHASQIAAARAAIENML